MMVGVEYWMSQTECLCTAEFTSLGETANARQSTANHLLPKKLSWQTLKMIMTRYRVSMNLIKVDGCERAWPGQGPELEGRLTRTMAI